MTDIQRTKWLALKAKLAAKKADKDEAKGKNLSALTKTQLIELVQKLVK